MSVISDSVSLRSERSGESAKIFSFSGDFAAPHDIAVTTSGSIRPAALPTQTRKESTLITPSCLKKVTAQEW